MAGVGIIARVGFGTGEVYPVETDVADGIEYGRQLAFEGSLDVSGLPGEEYVLEGQSVGGTPGTLTLPEVGEVEDGVIYGVGGTGSTGSLEVTGGGGAGYRSRYKR